MARLYRKQPPGLTASRGKRSAAGRLPLRRQDSPWSGEWCPYRILHPLARGAGSGRLSLNVRVSEPRPACPGLAIQDAGTAGSGDRDAAASVKRAPPARSLETEVVRRRPTALRLALSFVPVCVECRGHCPARDGHPLASGGLPPLLALEVALAWWAAKSSTGDPAPDPRDEPGQPTLGRSPHPRRTAEARDRCRAVDGRQVHGEGRARAVADLEDFPAQPCGRYRRWTS